MNNIMMWKPLQAYSKILLRTSAGRRRRGEVVLFWQVLNYISKWKGVLEECNLT
jgi:hypothetical protein